MNSVRIAYNMDGGEYGISMAESVDRLPDVLASSTERLLGRIEDADVRALFGTR
ncbi:hypothetical protein SAMN04488556_0759 [Halostagnicola kamekurae]|uniref:Uncharacterized protein n=1 Tax=Halostagnicola kamekurae TaxID=619731 RepID=A0A1I6PSN8_9EURY|nr:hypothetical protein SAMN04488556_0759 [Halostagnicola kamekurae]